MRLAQRLAYEWACRAFGWNHVQDLSVRALRVAEEAVELGQACDVPKEQMLKLVETVYSRPRGNVAQELGGVLLTSVVLAEITGLQADEVLSEELSRVLNGSLEHFAERNQAKLKLGLTGRAQVGPAGSGVNF